MKISKLVMLMLTKRFKRSIIILKNSVDLGAGLPKMGSGRSLESGE